MRHTIAALFVLLACARFASRRSFRRPKSVWRFARWKSISSVHRRRSTSNRSLRSQLARCGGASASGNCASHVNAAKLNYLFDVSVMLGDPDTAGTPPKPQRSRPTLPTTRPSSRIYNKNSSGARAVYLMSENRAKYWIILHCEGMKATYILMTVRTPEAVKASMGDDRSGKTKADVAACIKDTTRRRSSPTVRRRSNTAFRRRPRKTTTVPC